MFYPAQPEITAAMSIFPYSQELEDRYGFKTKYDDYVNMSVRVGNSLYVPRETCPVGKHDHRVSFPFSAIDCKPIVPRNDEQVPLIEKSIGLLKEGQCHIFSAPTGWGKTVAGGYVAAALGQPTLIVTTKSDLLDSWKKTLIEVLGISPKDIGLVRQNTCDWKGKRFVIGLVQSMVNTDKYPPEMYKAFGLMILDEVHMMAAEVFQRICWAVPARLRLGFSATTERRDGRSVILHAHIGKTMVKGTVVPMKAKVLVKKTGWEIPTIKKWDAANCIYRQVKIPHSAGRMMTVYGAMAESYQRNALIVEFVHAAYKHGRRVLVMAATRDHLNTLFHMFASAGVKGEEMGYYVGGMTKQQLERSHHARVILATEKMCSTGTDVPIWDTMILVVPYANVEQMIGRILRFGEDKNQPVICDMLDKDPILNGYHKGRLSSYAKVGAEVIYL